MNLNHFKKVGVKTCRKIYGNKFEKLISNVGSFSPDLSRWLVFEGYGKVLGRKGLSLIERELCIISVLSVLKFADQLYSHINGAIRVGLNYSDVKSVISNLGIINNQAGKKFGLRVFEKYKKEKGFR
jgi:4-carboxymuconolactone decarboxylase